MTILSAAVVRFLPWAGAMQAFLTLSIVLVAPPALLGLGIYLELAARRRSRGRDPARTRLQR